MELTNQHYQAAGFFTSGSISFLHFEDIVMALVLGFFGALGAWLFKKLIDYSEKRKTRK